MSPVHPEDVFDWRDHRRVGGDPHFAVDDLGQLLERSQAGLAPCLRGILLVALELFWCRSLSPLRDDLVDVEARVPEIEVAHAGVAYDRLPVGAPDHRVHGAPLLVVEAPVAARDGEAGGKALQIPLERPGQGLVEVVDAEDQLPVGRREGSEVREMRVTAELRVQARPRHSRQIRRHQVGGAAVERERGDEHPAVADRHELRHARLGLLLEQLDRRAPQGRSLPVGVGGTWHIATRRLAASRALARREVLDALGLALGRADLVRC